MQHKLVRPSRSGAPGPGAPSPRNANISNMIEQLSERLRTVAVVIRAGPQARMLHIESRNVLKCVVHILYKYPYLVIGTHLYADIPPIFMHIAGASMGLPSMYRKCM